MHALLSLLATIAVLLTLFSSCSVQQNTITSNIYHNLTAHYNGYYYAREKIQEIEREMLKTVDDDYNQIPRLYSKIDEKETNKYKDDAIEAIKMASISIQRHPNSKWLYANYTMVGIARLYAHDFGNAIQTLKYVNTKSRDINVRHMALIYLIRTLIENEQYDQAKEVLQFVEKEKLSAKNKKRLYLNKAYYYQVLKDYKKMAKSLENADISLTKKGRKGRIYLIAGQVHQRIGLNTKAYTYYKKCIAANPPYKIDLYAQMGLLQTTPLNDGRVIKKVNKTFSKALEDIKNTEFQNRIYYEMAEFEQKQGHLKEAMANYKSSLRAKGNKIVKGYAFLRLGQLYFDSLSKYVIAKKYYDSTLSFLPQNIDHYDRIQRKQEALERLTKHMSTIKWQDSLLYMASIDLTTLQQQLKATATEQQRKQEEAKKKLEVQKIELDNTPDNTAIEEKTDDTPGWYFESPSIVSLGKFDFQRIWGNISLGDNWRRSNKTTVVPLKEEEKSNEQEEEEERPENTLVKATNLDSEVQRIVNQLPVTDKEKKAAFLKIEDAYFNLGDIFQFELDRKNEAIKSYKAIVEHPAKFERVPEALYKLYLISMESNTQKTNKYYQQLVSRYPDSEFAKILLDPDYQKKKHAMLEKQKEIYRKAYTDFKYGRIKASQENINTALQIGETDFTPTLELLNILILGKTESLALYQSELESFLKKYPDSSLKSYTNALLTASKKVQNKLKDFNAIRYVKSLKEPHYFAVVYSQQSNISEPISSIVNTLMEQDRTHTQSGIVHKVLDDDHIITLVAIFPNARSSLTFLKKFNAQGPKSKILSAHLLRTFVITKSNAKILQRTKALNEYFAFFDRNYKDESDNLLK